MKEKRTMKKNEQVAFDTIDDVIAYYRDEENIEIDYDESEGLLTDFCNETQGLISQFNDWMKERYSEELSRPACPQCQMRVDESDLHKIAGDAELAYCTETECRDSAFEMAEKKLKW
jgi:hypothetical protein